MTLGERGGRTRSLAEGQALIEQHKASLAQAIRADIVAYLTEYGEWHRDNLRVKVPAESKNVVGAVVSGLVCGGVVVETGERRKSSDPASHGRKSNVFRLKTGTGSSQVGQASVASSCGPDRTEGDAAGNDSGGESSAGATSSAPVDPPRLFEIPEPDDGPGHIDIDQRAA